MEKCLHAIFPDKLKPLSVFPNALAVGMSVSVSDRRRLILTICVCVVCVCLRARVCVCVQLPADFSRLHLADGLHPQVTHVSSSHSGCSITSDSGSSSLSDIYQVRPPPNLAAGSAPVPHLDSPG